MPLSNSQFDAVMRHYDEIREKHRHLQNEHTERIYAQIPEILKLDDEVAVRSMEAAKARIADPTADLSDYRGEMLRIRARKQELLTRHGYTADYLEPTYDCPDCRDTGFVDGKRCHCFERVAAEMLYGSRGLMRILERENFRHFSFDWYSDTINPSNEGNSPRSNAENAVENAMELVESLDSSSRRSMYIYGNTGTGKTFLAHCIAREAIDKGHSVLYFSASDFFEVLAAAEFGQQNGHSAGKDLIESTDLLIIDDLGTELTNTFTASVLFRVVNERIASGLSTVISTNLSIGELSSKYSERVFSRVTSSYSIVRMTGDDIRIRKKLAQ